ncbi:hypothetical protein [Corynebacterium falsenii]|uniref:hypothetical protein n=1 Tax=Corynebacterium falsenii TaxID=108486 RepID=UPI003FD5AD19
MDEDVIAIFRELREKYERSWKDQEFSILFVDGYCGEYESALQSAVKNPPLCGFYLDEETLTKILEYFKDWNTVPEDLRQEIEDHYPDFAKRYYGQGSTA